MTAGLTKGTIEALFENGEEFGYGYSCGKACIRDVGAQKLRNRNAITFSTTSLEIGSRTNRKELLLHLWHPVDLDAGIAYLTASSVAQDEGSKGLAQAIWDFAKTLPPG
ncbi:hypothetical protein K3720_05395 [Leisingera caerulea]|uniref:hypothetical protein n=1 Tax=Leisingera caerulea TaxID=506591 RepID=UPI0021A7F0F8|nr:hypothetical protein [Leisingera caerulea]UWQ50843.1 hypothetical protein K3720_05395 [Leisingera caerulea]